MKNEYYERFDDGDGDDDDDDDDDGLMTVTLIYPRKKS